VRVTLTVNGDRHEVDVDAGRPLVDVLHEDCGLSDARHDCTDGTCGHCTVLVGGEAIRSCLMLAVQCDGAQVRTLSSADTSARRAPADGRPPRADPVW
jgi:aerobic carbon-monoxide dehydrogenase small subunit